MSNILVAIPFRANLHQKLRDRAVQLAFSMLPANPDHNFTFHFDCLPIDKQLEDNTPWAKVARVRNRMLLDFDIGRYDYVLWIDADVMEYPANMPSRLISANPDGITAPMVYIEGSTTLYDWAACIVKGMDTHDPGNRAYISGRNIPTLPPYWPTPPEGDFVEMDCVGTVTMVPSYIYRDAVYANHPAFTDHYPICKAIRDKGKKVGILRSVAAYHAYLPNYGEAFHE